MIRFVLVTLFLSFCADSLVAQGAPSDSAPTFKSGARLRAQISVPCLEDTKWFIGVAETGLDGCGLLILNDLPLPSQHIRYDGIVLVAFQHVIALQVSSLYDGLIDPETFSQRTYHLGKPLEGEEWLDVSVDSLKAADPAECRRP